MAITDIIELDFAEGGVEIGVSEDRHLILGDRDGKLIILKNLRNAPAISVEPNMPTSDRVNCVDPSPPRLRGFIDPNTPVETATHIDTDTFDVERIRIFGHELVLGFSNRFRKWFKWGD
jgi:hypothetical protein